MQLSHYALVNCWNIDIYFKKYFFYKYYDSGFVGWRCNRWPLLGSDWCKFVLNETHFCHVRRRNWSSRSWWPCYITTHSRTRSSRRRVSPSPREGHRAPLLNTLPISRSIPTSRTCRKKLKRFDWQVFLCSYPLVSKATMRCRVASKDEEPFALFLL